MSKTPEIALGILDNRLRIQYVNPALVAMHNGIPAEAFIGNTLRDIIGNAAPETEARLQRVVALGETPAREVIVKLPARNELGYWIEKAFARKTKSGKALHITTLSVEVTLDRKLEELFRALAGNLLVTSGLHRHLASDLHHAVDGYHTALGSNLERLSRYARDPARIPELLPHSMETLDIAMQNLASVVARCFPAAQQ
ncbi:MAG TPA: PAS domain-containing protein [Terriglobales bacterium]|nr:PAS domain-containing protein [Terriglobales bacterium]